MLPNQMHWKIEKGRNPICFWRCSWKCGLIAWRTKNIQRGTMIRTPELKRYDRSETAGLHEVMVACRSATSAVYPVLVCDLCRFTSGMSKQHDR